jgi:hypothetical protein
MDLVCEDVKRGMVVGDDVRLFWQPKEDLDCGGAIINTMDRVQTTRYGWWEMRRVEVEL